MRTTSSHVAFIQKSRHIRFLSNLFSVPRDGEMSKKLEDGPGVVKWPRNWEMAEKWGDGSEFEERVQKRGGSPDMRSRPRNGEIVQTMAQN